MIAAAGGDGVVVELMAPLVSVSEIEAAVGRAMAATMANGQVSSGTGLVVLRLWVDLSPRLSPVDCSCAIRGALSCGGRAVDDAPLEVEWVGGASGVMAGDSFTDDDACLDVEFAVGLALGPSQAFVDPLLWPRTVRVLVLDEVGWVRVGIGWGGCGVGVR